MNDGVELVLFFGPPFIGKTLHYFVHYSKTHSRISASEIFKEDKCSNLRLVILKAIALLQKGNNVVVDDENWYIATRKSFTSLVRKRIPNCTFTIVQFISEATSGYQQCLWAREWTLVEQTLLENKDYSTALLTESQEKLNCWFARRRSELNVPEFPTTTEGFSIITVKPQLVCGTCYKFSLPALFIQWHSLLADAQNENLNYKSAIPQVFNKWSEKYPSGRLVIIGPKTRNKKDIIDEETKTLLLHLASQLMCPLYFTFIDVQHQPDEYCRLPQPGVLAFLQKFHTINLYHKGTMYIYSNDDHYQAASSVGIRTIKAAKLFHHPHVIESIYCGDTSSASCFSQNVLQVNCPSSCKDCKETQKETVFEAQIPYFDRARKSSSPLTWKYCYGKVTGVCFRDRLTLERYQTQYKLAVQYTEEPDKVKPKTSRSDSVSSTHSSHKRSLFATEGSLAARAVVKNTDLRKIAETPGRYFAGFQCKDRVFDINVEVMERHLKINCKCSGSSRQPYHIQVMFSNSSELIEARCSCPDVSAKTGRCKHVIGLLLNYEDRSSACRVEPYEASSCKKCRGCDGNVSSATSKRGVQTLYCMSQEEFLETAEDILETNEEKQRQERFSRLETLNNNRTETLKYEEEDRPMNMMDKNQEAVLKKVRANKGKLCTKVCHEKISPSFAESTPTDKSCHQTTDPVTSVIIPDFLVHETISVVPETIPT